jgi:putative mRNA 3-end processing factor
MQDEWKRIFMKIKILGSGQEVGRSGILLQGDKTVSLDYGVKIEPPPPSYPVEEKIDAVVLSHSHLDHCGAIPMLFRKRTPAVFMNDVTLELAAMLIKDSIKVGRNEGYGTPFGKPELKKMAKATRIVTYKERFRVGNSQFSLWNSGHIPGSASIMVENGKKLYYTSDIQTTDSHLLKKCELPSKVDTLIIETTYGLREHPPREKIEREFIQMVQEAIAQGETALMPVFAIGRAQEVMMVLEKFADKIALDGMTKQASDIIAQYGSYLRSPEKLRAVLKKVKYVHTSEERKEALKKRPIIISSAGMMGGGPVVSYLREISRRRESKVLFTGFLVEDSPGRNLIETKIFRNAEEEFDVHCDVHQLSLSAHTDRRGIFDIIARTMPSTVICVHGDKCPQVAKDVEEHFRVQAFAPKNGEEIRI